MKRRYATLLAAAAILAAACTKENLPAPEQPGEHAAGVPENCVPLNLRVAADGGTRTSLSGMSTLWNPADLIGVFSPEAYYEWENSFLPGTLFYNDPVANKALAVEGEGGVAVTFGYSDIYDDEVLKFTGRFGWNTNYDTHNFYAYYPYAKGADALTKYTAVPFAIPAIQTQAAANDAGHVGPMDFLYAAAQLVRPAEVAATKTPVDADLVLSFRHAFALLALKVQNPAVEPVTITAVKIASASKALAGDCVVDLATGGVTMGKSTGQTGAVVEGASSKGVSVVFPGGITLERNVPVTVYAMVNAGDYTDGLSFTVETETQRQIFSGAFELMAGEMYSPAGTLNLNKLEEKPAYELQVVDFENVPAGLMASSAYGPNLYDGSYEGWEDPATGLWFGCNYGAYGEIMESYTMYDGGMFISQYNDMETVGYQNQCSVFCRDEKTGFGGHGGSKTFGLGFGHCDSIPSAYSTDNRPEIRFTDSKKEAVIDHAYIANTTYAALSMRDGDGFNKAFSYQGRSWFAWTATGYKADGSQSASVVFYLADFRTAGAGGIVTGWNKVDLTPLGEVNKVVFNLHSSDTGTYGMNTPSYFAIDDIAVRVPVNE